MNVDEINNGFGDIDLFLMDIILKGLIPPNGRVLDAGCGSGRNLFYFLHQPYTVHAVDIHPVEVAATNFIARQLGKGYVCVQANINALPFDSDQFDLVICSRVLHFSQDKRHFFQCLNELKRVLTKNGILYISTDSAIGMEHHIIPTSDGLSKFPDGTIRFLLTNDLLYTIDQEWEKVMDHRTVLFDQKHGETTLVLQKPY
jgi:ubiquinone/menaquinone biosynthesis C-methylase UbiE